MMLTISPHDEVFTVMVRITIEPEDQASLIEMMKKMQPVFQRQPGFIASAMLKSRGGTLAVNYLQWRSERDHEACMNSDEVAEAAKEFTALMEAGRASMEVQTFEVI